MVPMVLDVVAVTMFVCMGLLFCFGTLYLLVILALEGVRTIRRLRGSLQ